MSRTAEKIITILTLHYIKIDKRDFKRVQKLIKLK